MVIRWQQEAFDKIDARCGDLGERKESAGDRTVEVMVVIPCKGVRTRLMGGIPVGERRLATGGDR
jgi:hypothetical protein